MMKTLYVWDVGVRLFHWSLAAAFLANAFIVDDESDLHQYMGYFVMSLLLFRLLWGFIGNQYARFRAFPLSKSACLKQVEDIVLERHTLHIGHTPLGSVMIYNLLVSLALLTFSGFLMTTDLFWGTEWTEELHEICVSWVELSVVLHIAAVIFESKRTGVNLPKAMLNGYKTVPETHPAD